MILREKDNESSGGAVNVLVIFPLHSPQNPKYFFCYPEETENKMPKYCWVMTGKRAFYHTEMSLEPILQYL